MKTTEDRNVSHCNVGITRQRHLWLKRSIHTAMAVITTFFQNVSQLDSTNASPKHPQSATGFSKAIHNVRGSMTTMSSAAPIGAIRL